MDSSEGIVKTVDGIYKNILEKFNPGAKNLIVSSKSYLKNLHASAAASKVFIESLAKLAVNAHEGGTTDIGNALMDLCSVFNSIEDQHMNILKAFYVDFILPLENNIEKDTKVIHVEQKRFVQLHKQRIESFHKATTAMKKHRKKKNNAEKELKCIQALEEEKKLLDNFCDQSMKNALIQERRRYGFVLERSNAMAKHWSQYFEIGHSSIESNVEWWNDTAETRETLPLKAEVPAQMKKPVTASTSVYEAFGSVKSDLRKSQSIHASTGSLGHAANNNFQMSRPRAMSEHSLASSAHQSATANASAVTSALFAYLSSGENQLSFYEGDKILLIGEKVQGWQFGENLRTNSYGWFPISYVQQQQDRDTDGHESLKKSTEDLIENSSVGARRRQQEMNNQRESSVNPYQKLENPPSTVPPPPPSGSESMRIHGSATTNFNKSVQQGRQNNNKPSMHAIYSSNDSGFSNEIPPAAPEVDYSDDEDLPKKIPIREHNDDKNASDTEEINDSRSKSSPNMKQSNSFGNLTDSSRNVEHFGIDTTTMKRNKSFWRFSKSEDILEGMALWKHRDLVPIDIENAEKELTLKRQEKQNKKLDTLKKVGGVPNKKMEVKKNNDNDKRENDMRNRAKSFNGNYNKDPNNGFHHAEDDIIYDESPKRRNDMGPPSKSQKSKYPEKYSREIQDTNFYDDDVMVVKTVRRKEILKQYYSSGTDTELSSDPYDCIIVDDHLVPSTSTFRNRNSYAGDTDKRGSLYSRSSKTETLLPRTKLSKSTRTNSVEQFDVNERTNTAKSNKASNKSNFGPWSNMWPDEKAFN